TRDPFINSIKGPLDTRARQPRQLTLLAGASLFALLCATGGCQGLREAQSEPARILYDSLLAAKEAMYDSVGPNLGYERVGCVGERGRLALGLELVERLSTEAGREIRSHHSRTEWEAVNRGLAGDHQGSTPEFCTRIDSLWYARLAKPPSARLQP
ncbi:MAG TPA: hypothetical protein VIK25_04770, partial [Gemmatimonadaceae bacterium]